MRFMILVQADKTSESGVLPDQKSLAQMMKFNEEMAQAGVMLAGEGLHPTSKGARIKFLGGGKTAVINGPFPDSKELIAGFWLIQAKSKEEAIDWARRAPCLEGEVLEVRQIFETEEFAAIDPTGEIRAQEQQLRERIQNRT